MEYPTFGQSAGGGVGKTTLASAYAVYLAKKNITEDVALLDFSEVFPRIHKVFKAEHLSLSPIYDAISNDRYFKKCNEQKAGHMDTAGCVSFRL